MLSRLIALGVLAAALGGLAVNQAAGQDKKPEDAAKARKALQELQEFIGLWNLEGTQRVSGKIQAWKEKVSWSWKFKDGDAWLMVDFAEGKGKYFKSGTLKYDLEKKKYVLALTHADKSEHLYEGELAKGMLKLDRKDAKTGDVHRLTMNTLAEGIRLQLRSEKQDGGKGLFATQYTMAGSKDGESIAGTKKKPECIVSGGAATMPVSYQGKQYFVCCSGCRDEFNANPEKYIAAKK